MVLLLSLVQVAHSGGALRVEHGALGVEHGGESMVFDWAAGSAAAEVQVGGWLGEKSISALLLLAGLWDASGPAHRVGRENLRSRAFGSGGEYMPSRGCMQLQALAGWRGC